MTFLRKVPVVVSMLLPLGCAGWQRIDLPLDTTLARRQQVQVWRRNQATVVHAVRVTPESISWVPFVQPPSCDSCVVTFPRAQVDSLRLGEAEWVALSVTAVSVLLVVLLWTVVDLE